MLREPLVDADALPSFNKVVEFVKQHPALSSRFDVPHLPAKGGVLDLDFPDIYARAHIQGIIDRYAHVYGSGQRRPQPPSAHRTVRTGPYTAPHASRIQ